MKIQPIAAIFLFVALTLCACQPAVEQAEADVTAIRTLVQAWGEAVKISDVDAIVALYTDDIVQMPPDVPANRGKQAVEEYFRPAFELFSIKATWPVEGTEEIIVADGWAFYISEYFERLIPKTDGDTIELQGKIIEICQQQPDGSWKFAREIWNSNSSPSKE